VQHFEFIAIHPDKVTDSRNYEVCNTENLNQTRKENWANAKLKEWPVDSKFSHGKALNF